MSKQRHRAEAENVPLGVLNGGAGAASCPGSRTGSPGRTSQEATGRSGRAARPNGRTYV